MGNKIVTGFLFVIELIVLINLFNYIRLIFSSENKPYTELAALIFFGFAVAMCGFYLIKISDQTWNEYILIVWNFIKQNYVGLGICFLFTFIGLIVMGAPGALIAYVADFIQSSLGLKSLHGEQILSLGIIYTICAPVLIFFSYVYFRKTYPNLNGIIIFIIALSSVLILLFSIQLIVNLFSKSSTTFK